MYEDKYITILSYLHGKDLIPTSTIKINDIDNDTLFDVLVEMDGKGLVKMFTGQVCITEKGESYLKAPEPIKEALSINIGHIGHKIEGSVYDSDLSMDMSRDKHITSNKTDSPNTKKSVLEWVAIIIGIVAGIIGIYWFFTK